MQKHEQSPFEILRLDTKATPQDVMARARDLAQDTNEDARKAEIRRAAEAVRQHPARRAFHQFWEPAETCYQDDALDGFCAQNEPSPFTPMSLRPGAQRLAEVHCAARSLAELVLPPLPPGRSDSDKLTEMPPIPVELPLEPWELFACLPHGEDCP